jgi:UDP-N-acetyl-D-mannosaminuronate dehydrogenase
VPVFPIGGHLFAQEADRATLRSVELSEDELRTSDAVVIAIGHDGIDYDRVVQHAPLVVDAVNATRGCAHGHARIRRLGAPPG